MKNILSLAFLMLLPVLVMAQTESTMPKTGTDDCNTNAPLWLVEKVWYKKGTMIGMVEFRDSLQTKYRFSRYYMPHGVGYKIMDSATHRITDLTIDTATGLIRLLNGKDIPQVISNCRYPAIVLPTSKATPLLAGLVAYSFSRGLDFQDFIWTNECDPDSPLGKEARRFQLLLISITQLGGDWAKTGMPIAKKAYGLSHKNSAEGSLAFTNNGFMVGFDSYRVEGIEIPPYQGFCEN